MQTQMQTLDPDKYSTASGDFFPVSGAVSPTGGLACSCPAFATRCGELRGRALTGCAEIRADPRREGRDVARRHCCHHSNAEPVGDPGLAVEAVFLNGGR